MGDQSASGSRNSIRFVLDGEVIELRDISPTRTVLQFLREDLRRTGTKEGCAEGDCGACTVVVADIDESGERLSARAVNSCIQFLPTLDGKELITVESISRHGLHPAQTALLDSHGSQCGFCTPGIVMSLFALYKSNSNPGRREIDDALAGNLCRCTGYSPIIIAALQMYSTMPADNRWDQLPAELPLTDDERNRVKALQSLKSDVPLVVTHGRQRFLAPQTEQQLAEMTTANPDASLLAGGTDLGLTVTKALQDPDVFIYTGNVAELRKIQISESHLEIGAAVSLSDAMTVIVEHFPNLEELFLRFASPPIRNAGTLGGNVANGSPIGDSMPALLALDSELEIRKQESTRTVPLNEFYVSYQSTALKPVEFITRIRIPLPSASSIIRSYKISKRFDQDISAVCAAFRLDTVDDQIVDARVAFGGMAEIPKRAPQCESAMAGNALTEETVIAAQAALDRDFVPVSDLRASADYRRKVCRNLLRRLYLDVTGQEKAGIYRYDR